MIVMDSWPLSRITPEPISHKELYNIKSVTRNIQAMNSNPRERIMADFVDEPHVRVLRSLHNLTCSSKAWTIVFIKAIIEKFSLIILDDPAQEEVITRKTDGVKRKLVRTMHWHKPGFIVDWEERARKVRVLNTCRNCLTLTQDRKRCRCMYERLNAKNQINPHYDVDIDKSEWDKRLKPAPCLVRGTCTEVNCGYSTMQYYMERAIFNNSPKLSNHYLLKALELDWEHCEEWRNWDKKWKFNSYISLPRFTSPSTSTDNDGIHT